MKLHCVNNISLNTVWLPSFNLTEYCNAFLHFRTFTLMYVHPWRYTNTHSYISLRVIHSKKLLEHIVGYSAQHYHHHNYMMLSTALAPNQSIGSILFKEFLRGKPLKAHVTAIFSLHICQIDHSSLHQFLLILFPLTTSASRSLIIPWCSHGITTLGQITITPPKTPNKPASKSSAPARLHWPSRDNCKNGAFEHIFQSNEDSGRAEWTRVMVFSKSDILHELPTIMHQDWHLLAHSEWADDRQNVVRVPGKGSMMHDTSCCEMETCCVLAADLEEFVTPSDLSVHWCWTAFPCLAICRAGM